MTRRSARIALFSVLALACVAGDRATKWLAVDHLRGEEGFELLGGTVRVLYAENTGAFLGLGARWPDPVRFAVFTLGTAAVLVGVAVALARHWSASPPRFVAGALVLAGGAANLFDRVVDGYVVDFLNVGVGPVRTGIFNVADVAITAGVVLLLWPLREERTQPAGDPEGAAPEDLSAPGA